MIIRETGDGSFVPTHGILSLRKQPLKKVQSANTLGNVSSSALIAPFPRKKRSGRRQPRAYIANISYGHANSLFLEVFAA